MVEQEESIGEYHGSDFACYQPLWKGFDQFSGVGRWSVVEPSTHKSFQMIALKGSILHGYTAVF